MNGNQLLPESLKIKTKRLAVNLHILSCSKLVKTRKKHWFGLFNNDATHYKICMFSWNYPCIRVSLSPESVLLASWSLNWHTVSGRGWLIGHSSSLERSYALSLTHLSPGYVNTTEPLPPCRHSWARYCVESDMNQTTSCVPQATHDGTGTTPESRFIWSVSCHPCAHLLTQPTIKSPGRRSSTLRATLSASSFKTNSNSRGAWWKRVFW